MILVNAPNCLRLKTNFSLQNSEKFSHEFVWLCIFGIFSRARNIHTTVFTQPIRFTFIDFIDLQFANKWCKVTRAIWGVFLSHNIFLLQSDKNGIFNPPGRVLDELWLIWLLYLFVSNSVSGKIFSLKYWLPWCKIF